MFSIVITTKNRVDFLTRAIESIYNSTTTPTDIVIINDGGVMITEDLFPASKSTFTIINHANSKGANFCRNLGIDLAIEDIVFLLDDDDALEPDSLETRLAGFNDKSVGIVFTGIKVVSSDDLLSVEREVMPYDSKSYFRDLICNGNFIGSTSRVAIKKDWFYLAGKFDENLPCFQDYDLWIRMAEVCKIVSDSRAGVYYTIHNKGEQISSNYQKYLLASDYLVSKYYDKLITTKYSNSFKGHLYLRVALASASSATLVKLKYSGLSFIYKPTLKALALLLLPVSVIKKFFNFV